MEEKKKVDRPLIYAILGVTLLVLAVSGSAYAYFQASASNNTAIQGNTLDINLSITSLSMVSAGTGDLIPIYDGTLEEHINNQLTQAVTSAKVTAQTDCIDNNGYTVCQVYELKIKNDGSNATTINTTVTVNGGTNIKWAKMTNRNTPESGTGNVDLSTGTLASDVTIGADGSTITQYFVVYLKNTGDNQTTDDAGKDITGTVTVSASTGPNIEAKF